MQREIKFRGKSIGDGKWVYGFFLHVIHKNGLGEGVDYNRHQIYEQSSRITWDVSPESVGQFTGLVDKNNLPIFEGDLVDLEGWKPGTYQIKFIEGAFCFAWYGGNSKTFENGEFVADIHCIEHAGHRRSTIIGNVFDNPEKGESI